MEDKIVNVKFSVSELEELLHATITSYMEYDEKLYLDLNMQNKYNESVRKFNNIIDGIRFKIKTAIENAKDVD